MSPKAMVILFMILLLLLLVVSQAAAIAVPDTVMCRKSKGECSFLLCPLFKRATGTCYNGLAKCCRPFW
ncbi:beta-defensin 1 [Cuculus canorus]|uniref:beta-defensin 1 n=1 Tax=Cuculus canorus TaxID=55661 RepID=UPI0023AA6483|nr:beta-defensin 1 [Cuculus canorus]XP_053919218.1 beta-defensin 1 [Cuculus canorus]XP_053919219.1 beta-defensin 1 [Cuculus canorus]XP_053919220.1 beta-defensin 1 [Cuculus canorus]